MRYRPGTGERAMCCGSTPDEVQCAMIVDYQGHWYPETYFESILNRDGYPRTERRSEGGYYLDNAPRERWFVPPLHTDLEAHFASMDDAGIDVVVSSPNMVCDVGWLDLAEARDTVQLANEETARVQREHSDRFVGLAMLPMQDTDAALTELNRAVTELGLKGVTVIANIGGEQIASERTLPIFRRIAELGVPLFLHPSHRSVAFGMQLGTAVERGLNWMWDTSLAVLSLIRSGTLDACPTLTVVHPHLGGVLPYVLGRVSWQEALPDPLGTLEVQDEYRPSLQEAPIEEYLRTRIYTDTVSYTTGALRLAIDTYGLDRVLFATDYPWQLPRARALDLVRAAVPEAEAEAILHENRLPALALPTAAK
jgi:aminocarboxymuconate-semialdehyde decarboxylase